MADRERAAPLDRELVLAARLRGAGHVQAADALRREAAVERALPVAEQRAAKGAVQHEVEVLLELDRVVRVLAQALRDVAGQVVSLHQLWLRLAAVWQAVRGGARGELVEVERRVRLLEIFVDQIARPLAVVVA